MASRLISRVSAGAHRKNIALVSFRRIRIRFRQPRFGRPRKTAPFPGFAGTSPAVRVQVIRIRRPRGQKEAAVLTCHILISQPPLQRPFALPSPASRAKTGS